LKRHFVRPFPDQAGGRPSCRRALPQAGALRDPVAGAGLPARGCAAAACRRKRSRRRARCPHSSRNGWPHGLAQSEHCAAPCCGYVIAVFPRRQAARHLASRVDPVARFHLGNGARLERLNWRGDISADGPSDPGIAGIMVNYLYDLSRHRGESRGLCPPRRNRDRRAVPAARRPGRQNPQKRRKSARKQMKARG
jgi:hypothetical protein